MVKKLYFAPCDEQRCSVHAQTGDVCSLSHMDNCCGSAVAAKLKKATKSPAELKSLFQVSVQFTSPKALWQVSYSMNWHQVVTVEFIKDGLPLNHNVETWGTFPHCRPLVTQLQPEFCLILLEIKWTVINMDFWYYEWYLSILHFLASNQMCAYLWCGKTQTISRTKEVRHPCLMAFSYKLCSYSTNLISVCTLLFVGRP